MRPGRPPMVKTGKTLKQHFHEQLQQIQQQHQLELEAVARQLTDYITAKMEDRLTSKLKEEHMNELNFVLGKATQLAKEKIELEAKNRLFYLHFYDDLIYTGGYVCSYACCRDETTGGVR